MRKASSNASPKPLSRRITESCSNGSIIVIIMNLCDFQLHGIVRNSLAKICMPHAIQIRQTGGPEVLNWTAVDVGEPGTGQVRLRQAAAGLNYIDVWRRTGPARSRFPYPGVDSAGTVEAVAQMCALKSAIVAYAAPSDGYSEDEAHRA